MSLFNGVISISNISTLLFVVFAVLLLGYALGYCGLSHARLTDQNGIVLRSAAEDLQDPPYLLVSTDDGIELALRCPLIEIDSEPAQIFKLVFCHFHFLLYYGGLTACSLGIAISYRHGNTQNKPSGY